MDIENKIYTFEDVYNVYSTYIHDQSELSKIKEAYEFAKLKHKDQFRKSGDPYIVHLIAVAHILASLQTGPSTIIAGLLHDTIEDTDTTADVFKSINLIFNIHISSHTSIDF